ncbi:MAG: hypothetical protein KKD59_01495, partial [Acidobacteria bacterium]|nr:hypothetical protein [Acidobacteriota bacterium]
MGIPQESLLKEFQLIIDLACIAGLIDGLGPAVAFERTVADTDSPTAPTECQGGRIKEREEAGCVVALCNQNPGIDDPVPVQGNGADRTGEGQLEGGAQSRFSAFLIHYKDYPKGGGHGHRARHQDEESRP